MLKTDGARGAAEGPCWISRGGGAVLWVGSPRPLPAAPPGPRPGLSASLEGRGGGCCVTPGSLGTQLLGNCGHLSPPPTLRRPETKAPSRT